MSKRQSKPSIAFANFCKPASLKIEPNPPEHDITLAYYYAELALETLLEASGKHEGAGGE